MRRLKGLDVPSAKIWLLIIAIILFVLAVIFLFRTFAGAFKPGCWNDPYGKLVDLKNGDTAVDFMGCVGKVIFTNDLNTVKNEIDIYKYCNEKDRLKDYGSFLVIIPAKDPQISTAWKTFDTLTPGELLKPACLWRNYGIYKNVVFEGSGNTHCIHMEDDQKNPTVIKLISQC
ncbi:MAG: hypothetical protein GTN39_00580 [Candidatus Aenigmarchaeota archaeon]|nr:hypothetical protein [Candidatus Aenigmarchaeota archaeon]